jgi:hypothetical protein
MTDRIRLGDTRTILGMYTGSIPTYNLPYTLGSISWKDTGTDYAALIRHSSPDEKRISVFSFYDQPREVGILFWDLGRGEYEIRIGADNNDDGRMDGPPEIVLPFTMNKRGDEARFDLPPRQLSLIEVQQINALPPEEGPLPDIGVSRADIPDDISIAAGTSVEIPVAIHNIGASETGPFKVALLAVHERSVTEITAAEAVSIPAPHDFESKTQTVTLAGDIPERTTEIRILCDPENIVDEIYERNNTITVTLQ